VLGAGWVERNAGKDEVQERRFEKVIADAQVGGRAEDMGW